MQQYSSKQSVLHYSKMLVILVALYLVTGKLGLLLALPPVMRPLYGPRQVLRLEC